MFNVLLEVLPANFLLDRTWFIEDDTAYYISVHVVHDPKLPPGVWGGGGVGEFWLLNKDLPYLLKYHFWQKGTPFIYRLLKNGTFLNMPPK